jgi:hypothetical protein
MIIYYLYIKTHNKTGLKYLGQTSKQNPFTYMGSGVDWVAHLNENGIDVTTQIIIGVLKNPTLFSIFSKSKT